MTQNAASNSECLDDETSRVEDAAESIPYANIRERKVVIQPYDWPVRTLMDMVVEGDLVLDPDYQRNYRWSDLKASRFIESILLNIPVPVIYLAEESDGSYTIIDGQQRITSLFRYMKSSELSAVFPGEQLTELEITDLLIRDDINAVKYTSLEPIDRSTLAKRPIRCIVVLNESDSTLKYEVFERLNTGSSQLTHQEVRNCIYRGTFNNLIKRLAKLPKFLELLNLPKADLESMKSVELVLRFFAYQDLTEQTNYSDNYNEYLNSYMENNKEISLPRSQMLEGKFVSVVDKMYAVLGPGAAFRKATFSSSSQDPTFNRRLINGAIYESQMISISRYLDAGLSKSDEQLKQLFIESFQNALYTDNIYQGTARKARALLRSRVLTEILVG